MSVDDHVDVGRRADEEVTVPFSVDGNVIAPMTMMSFSRSVLTKNSLKRWMCNQFSWGNVPQAARARSHWLPC